MSEIFESQEFIKATTTKTSELAIVELWEARRTRHERIQNFDRANLSDTEKENYIGSIEEELKSRANAIRSQIYEIGRLLLDVKSLLGHGQFGEWLEECTPFSRQTALNCMRVYKACLGQPELVSYFNPSALYVICAPNFPASLRSALFNHADNEGVVFDIGQGELLQTAVKWKRGEVNLQSPEVQNLMLNQKRQTLYERYEVEIKSIITVMEGKLKKMEEFAKYSNVQPLLHEDDTEEWDPYTDIEAVVYSCIGDLQTLISNLQAGEMPAEHVTEARRIYFAVAD